MVDDEQAFLGGFNIHRESSRRAVGDARWRDAHVRFDGALVEGLPTALAPRPLDNLDLHEQAAVLDRLGKRPPMTLIMGAGFWTASASRAWKARMPSSVPATTQPPGSLTVARSTSSERYCAIASGPRVTATMTPRGAVCISRARIATTLMAVGRSNTPAMVAAAYSPMLCPAMAAGTMP